MTIQNMTPRMVLDYLGIVTDGESWQTQISSSGYSW